jgi:hypothetical protein
LLLLPNAIPGDKERCRSGNTEDDECSPSQSPVDFGSSVIEVFVPDKKKNCESHTENGAQQWNVVRGSHGAMLAFCWRKATTNSAAFYRRMISEQ